MVTLLEPEMTWAREEAIDFIQGLDVHSQFSLELVVAHKKQIAYDKRQEFARFFVSVQGSMLKSPADPQSSIDLRELARKSEYALKRQFAFYKLRSQTFLAKIGPEAFDQLHAWKSDDYELYNKILAWEQYKRYLTLNDLEFESSHQTIEESISWAMQPRATTPLSSSDAPSLLVMKDEVISSLEEQFKT